MLDSGHIMVKYFDEEIDIHKEKHKVLTSNQIQLEYLPSENLNISIYLNNKEIDSSKYTTDYESGVILFTDTFINQMVLVDYSAVGEICISASKVYTNYDNKENILETLESLIDEQREIINQVKVIGDVRTIILQMEQNINNLLALYDAVVNNEKILNNINQKIQECINKKDELVLAINNATEQANTAKDELISTKNSCKSEINTLVSSSKSEMNSFTTEKKNELTQTANTCVSNVNNATQTANNKMSELNQWVLDNGDIIDLNNRINEKQDKTDDSLTTVSKELVGAINEIKEKVDYLDEFKIVHSDKATDRGYRLYEDGYCRAWESGTQSITGNALDITITMSYTFKNQASCSIIVRAVDISNKPIILIPHMVSNNQVRLVYPSTMTPQLANGTMSYYVCVEGY